MAKLIEWQVYMPVNIQKPHLDISNGVAASNNFTSHENF